MATIWIEDEYWAAQYFNDLSRSWRDDPLVPGKIKDLSKKGPSLNNNITNIICELFGEEFDGEPVND